MSNSTTARSRAYPVLTLADSARAVGVILERLGAGSYSREVLAEMLGHSNAHGGPGARKVAALTQYGLLRRSAGLYSPTPLARRVAGEGGPAARQAALRQALGRPQLFRELLERFASQGRLPRQLASILWRDHGITRKASGAAAETFKESARYAGVLELDGSLLAMPLEGAAADASAAPGEAEAVAPGPPRQRFELALTHGKLAKLSLPLKLCRKDLEIVKRQLELLEFQMTEED